MVRKIGSGVSTTAVEIKSILQDYFGYEFLNIIKPSNIIRENGQRVGVDFDQSNNAAETKENLQTAGNKLREKFSNDYIAEKCIDTIITNRIHIMEGCDSNDVLDEIRPMRIAHIIDSLKHPDEASLLKTVYGSMFHLFAVTAPSETIETRLRYHAKMSKADMERVLERDEFEERFEGQKLRKTVELADYFIGNDFSSTDDLRDEITRYLDIILGLGSQHQLLMKLG